MSNWKISSTLNHLKISQFLGVCNQKGQALGPLPKIAEKIPICIT